MPCDRVMKSSAGVRVAIHGELPERAASRRTCVEVGTEPERSDSRISACVAQRLPAAPVPLGLVIQRDRIGPWKNLTRHEFGERLAEGFGVIGGFFSFCGETAKPVGRINAFSAECDSTDDNGDARLQTAIGYLQDVAVLTQIDRDTGARF
jgi:hypothetical protein